MTVFNQVLSVFLMVFSLCIWCNINCFMNTDHVHFLNINFFLIYLPGIEFCLVFIQLPFYLQLPLSCFVMLAIFITFCWVYIQVALLESHENLQIIGTHTSWSYTIHGSSLTPTTMAPHSSTLAWKIPWMEEPGGPQSMGSLRVRHDWATSLSLFTFTHWGRQWQPTPVFLPGESQGWGSLVGCRLWGRMESDTTEAT